MIMAHLRRFYRLQREIFFIHRFNLNALRSFSLRELNEEEIWIEMIAR